MEKIPQRLDRKLSQKYTELPVAGLGQRKPDFSAPDRKKKHAPDLREVVLVEACRTPYGRFGGALKGFTAPELGALAIQEVLRRTNGKVKPGDVDYVFMGQVVAAGSGVLDVALRAERGKSELAQRQRGGGTRGSGRWCAVRLGDEGHSRCGAGSAKITRCISRRP